MPRTSVDYSKTVIYKIQHNENETLLYVGSTTDFTNRKSQHKCACTNQKDRRHNLKVYKMIRDNGGWDSFSMVKIEDFPCKSGRDAECREDELMRELKANMNAIRAFLTPEEKVELERRCSLRWREANREAEVQRVKQWQQENPERRAEIDRRWREANREHAREYNRKYREENREKLAERCMCDVCDVHVLRTGFKTHLKTHKHIKNQRILDEANQ